MSKRGMISDSMVLLSHSIISALSNSPKLDSNVFFSDSDKAHLPMMQLMLKVKGAECSPVNFVAVQKNPQFV
jgi:hypothetical protein